MSLVILFRTGIAEAVGSASGRAFSVVTDDERHGFSNFGDQMYGGYLEEIGNTFLSTGGRLISSDFVVYQYGGTTTTHARLYDVYWNGTHWIPNTLLAESDPLVFTGSGTIAFHHIFSGYDLVAGTRYAIVFNYTGPSSSLAYLFYSSGWPGTNAVSRPTPAGIWSSNDQSFDFAVYRAGEISFSSGAVAGSGGSASGAGAATGASSKVAGAAGASTGVGAASGVGVAFMPAPADGNAVGSGVASGVSVTLMPATGASAGTANPLLIDEGFEGVGAPPGWSEENGTIDWDYTTAPLVGSQSLRLSESGEVVYQLSGEAEIWMKFRFKLESADVFQYLFWFYDLANLQFVRVDINEDGTFTLNSSAGYEITDTVDGITVGVEYDVYFHFRIDGFAEFSFVEAGGLRPTSGNKYTSIPDAILSDIGSLTLATAFDEVSVFDDVQIAFADIFAGHAAGIWDSVGASVGTGAVSGVSSASARFNANSVGVGNVTSVASVIVGASASSVGSGAATSTTSSLWDSIGSAAGVGAAAANTAARWNSVYSSVGDSLVLGRGTDAATGSDASTAGLGSAQAITAVYVSASGIVSCAATVNAQSATFIQGVWASQGAGTAIVNSLILSSTVFSSSGYGEGYGFTQTTYCGTGEAEGSSLVEGHPYVIPTFEYFLDLEHGAKQSQSGIVGLVAGSGIAALRAQSEINYPRSD